MSAVWCPPAAFLPSAAQHASLTSLSARRCGRWQTALTRPWSTAQRAPRGADRGRKALLSFWDHACSAEQTCIAVPADAMVQPTVLVHPAHLFPAPTAAAGHTATCALHWPSCPWRLPRAPRPSLSSMWRIFCATGALQAAGLPLAGRSGLHAGERGSQWLHVLGVLRAMHQTLCKSDFSTLTQQPTPCAAAGLAVRPWMR